jgi:hypothetical protein
MMKSMISSFADWGSSTMTAEESSLLHYTLAQEPSNDFVLGGWQVQSHLTPSSENGSSLPSYDDEDLMVVDSIDMDFDDMDDEIPPTPPADRLLLEEALEETLDQIADNDDDSFFTTHSELSPAYSTDNKATTVTSFLPIDQRYQATLDKLAESMKKSQETRKSLRIKTTETMEYTRWRSISETVSSIEKSTLQLQQILKHKNPAVATAQHIL